MIVLAVSSRGGPRRYRRWLACGAGGIGYFDNNILEPGSTLRRLRSALGSCGSRTAALGFPLRLRKGPAGMRIAAHAERPEGTLDNGATSDLAGLTRTALKAVSADGLQRSGAGMAQGSQVGARHVPWVTTDDLAGKGLQTGAQGRRGP